MTQANIIAPQATVFPAASGRTPHFASPARALRFACTQNFSGRLCVRDPHDRSIEWQIYVSDGTIHFANSASGQQDRLAYLLQWYYPELLPLQLDPRCSDYQAICTLWKSGKLSWQQARKLLLWLTQDAFVHALTSQRAEIRFEKSIGLDPLLLSVSPKQVLQGNRWRVDRWRQLSSLLASPFRKPVVTDSRRVEVFLYKLLPGDRRLAKRLLSALHHNLSLYEIASHAKVEVLALANLLEPLAASGAIAAAPPEEVASACKPAIACIDDSPTVQCRVRSILENAGYETLSVMKPVEAIATLEACPPDVILLDICMPQMDGYEVCRRIRKSPQLQEIPVLMLTGRDSLVDRLRSHMMGIAGYLTKPFDSTELLAALASELPQPSVPTLEATV